MFLNPFKLLLCKQKGYATWVYMSIIYILILLTEAQWKLATNSKVVNIYMYYKANFWNLSSVVFCYSLNFFLCGYEIYLVFTRVFHPMRMPEIPIICLFILYKTQTDLSILAYIWNKASLYVIALCPCSKNRVNTKSDRG